MLKKIIKRLLQNENQDETLMVFFNKNVSFEDFNTTIPWLYVF
jgi:hypothetical protein